MIIFDPEIKKILFLIYERLDQYPVFNLSSIYGTDLYKTVVSCQGYAN